MAEEIPQPERNIPIAILSTVVTSFVTLFPFIIGMLFSLNDFDAVANTSTYWPILELFYQALGSKAGAIILQTMLVVCTFGGLIACHTWQSRLAWTFARDGGLPLSSFLAKVHPKLDVPLNAHIFGSLMIALLGCLYLASSSGFARYCCVVLMTS